jgi:histidinol-phosphate aminotransferase
MPISRRSFFQRLGASAVAEAAVQSLSSLSLGQASQTPQSLSQLARPVLLDQNENAFGPSEKVIATLREALAIANRYPRSELEVLRAKLAALHTVKEEQILLGCGSSEILRLAVDVLLGSGRRLVQAAPTYPALGDLARGAGVEVVDVPLTKRYEHDLDAMLAHADSSTGLVYICNPNNPTATLTPRKDIESFIRKLPGNVTILIDEAYCHFVSPHLGFATFLEHPFDDPRLVVCRTFSKVYGLAGMRVGYAVGAPDLLRRLSDRRLQYGISAISAKAAAGAVDDADYVRLAVKRNSDDRQEFMNQVNIRMLRALDSHTNFVAVNPMRPPEQVIEHLKTHNVLIGPLIPAMPKYVRISLGTPADMEKLWAAWDLMPATGKMAM